MWCHSCQTAGVPDHRCRDIEAVEFKYSTAGSQLKVKVILVTMTTKLQDYPKMFFGYGDINNRGTKLAKYQTMVVNAYFLDWRKLTSAIPKGLVLNP